MNDQNPKPYMTRCVTFLSCDPGSSSPMNDGQALVALTFAYRGEIEEPTTLSLDDSKRLAVGLLHCLSYHGDQRAQSMLEQFFPNVEIGCGDWIDHKISAAPTTIIKPQPSLVCDLPDFNQLKPRGGQQRVLIRVRARQGREQYQLRVEGALRCDQSVLLMCCSTIKSEQRVTLKVTIPSTDLELPPGDEKIDAIAWPVLTSLAPGRTAQRGAKTWTVLGKHALRRMLSDKVFVLPPDRPIAGNKDQRQIVTTEKVPEASAASASALNTVMTTAMEDRPVSNDPFRCGRSAWMQVREKGKRTKGRMEVVGGFGRGPHLLLMCIMHRSDGSQTGHTFRLHVSSFKLRVPPQHQVIEGDNWESYVTYNKGRKIHCKKECWTKMSQGFLQRIFDKNVCVLVG